MNTTLTLYQLEGLDNQLLFTYLMHIHGINPRVKISRSQFFKHKKIFRELYGFDLTHPIPDNQRTAQTPLTVAPRDTSCGTREIQNTINLSPHEWT